MWFYFAITIFLLATPYFVNRLERWIIKRRFEREFGTKDPIKIIDVLPPEGGDYNRETIRAFQEHRGLELIRERHEAGGYTFQSQTLGGRIINTSEPENIRAILATRFQDYSLGFRQAALGPLLGRGVFTTDGEEWEHSRGLARPNFTKAHITDLSNLERHVGQLLAHIPRDVDVSAEFLFGESMHSFDASQNSSEASFAAAFDYASGETIRRLHYGSFLFLYFNREFTRSCKIVHDFVDSVVAKALTKRKNNHLKSSEKDGEDSRYIFLEGLMDSVTDPKRLRSETLNIMQAGRDTTASLLSQVVYILARRPGVWDKLVAETAQLNGRPPTHDELRKLTYLRYVLNETLRIRPVAPINSRVAVRDTILPTGGGPDHKAPVFIPKGQKVSFPMYALHRRKDIYGPDANEFRPERWEEPDFPPNWSYIPFNKGPRTCLGQQFALTEAGYTIVRLVQTFKAIEQRDNTPYKESVKISASIFGGVKVGMIFRE